jgi:hypothetical protein
MWVTANWLRVACLHPSCQLIRQLYIRPRSPVHGKLYIQAVVHARICIYRHSYILAVVQRCSCTHRQCLYRQLYIQVVVHNASCTWKVVHTRSQAVLLIGSCTYRQLYIYAVDTTGICIYNQLSIKAVVHTGSCTYMQLYIQAVVHTGSCAAVHTSRFIKANSGCIQRRRLFTASYTHIMKIVGSLS